MSVAVVEQLIPVGHPNRPGSELRDPEGVVWHRTGKDLGSIWLGGYFAREPRQAIIDNDTFGSSQYGIGDEGIRLYVPENEVAWHCRAGGRSLKDIGVELCQYFDVPPRIRPITYGLAVDLAADLCVRYGWAGPREPIPGDPLGRLRFRRHQDEDPIDRPNDTGDYLRWDDFLNDVEESLLTGLSWQKRKEGATVEQAILELVTKVASLGTSILVWLARLQRGLDVERGKPFDATLPPMDPRVIKND